MLAGRKRKRKCSTGKVLTASAVRPNARCTKRENREEENGSLTVRFSHTASAVRPNAHWTKRENVSALPGKFSLRPLRDQMLAGQKEETGKRKMGA